MVQFLLERKKCIKTEIGMNKIWVNSHILGIFAEKIVIKQIFVETKNLDIQWKNKK